ncbi:uncharacterized protein LOC100898054 [Galendromus occidentalis]|uniref:Uncharacterized protein LOC100898054 n=1 Tax=Galendromus occidentalis TaxID=34638 RepID=A0AAJ6QL37_9ACAR|nr:uncharacterized protein LOC100898054 [Galendromus occidentalis]
MKFLILVLSVGLALAQERNATTESGYDVTSEATTEIITRQVCDGKGKLVTRVGCLETCSRAFKIGRLPIFTTIRENEPCKTSILRRQNNGICVKVTRLGISIGVCRKRRDDDDDE